MCADSWVSASRRLPHSCRSGYAGWKLGLTWDEPDIADAADIDVRVRDTVTNTIIASQTDYAIHNRIRLANAALVGRRLQVCVQAFHVPPGQTRKIFVTDFAHNHWGD